MNWIPVGAKVPPIKIERYEDNLLLWIPRGEFNQDAYAWVGYFDGAKFWTENDYYFEVEPSHWMEIVAP